MYLRLSRIKSCSSSIFRCWHSIRRFSAADWVIVGLVSGWVCEWSCCLMRMSSSVSRRFSVWIFWKICSIYLIIFNVKNLVGRSDTVYSSLTRVDRLSCTFQPLHHHSAISSNLTHLASPPLVIHWSAAASEMSPEQVTHASRGSCAD